MTVFTEYLTSEVVEDFADGIIGRREAIRAPGHARRRDHCGRAAVGRVCCSRRGR